MAREGDLVLPVAWNLPLASRDLHVLAHREAGRRLAKGGRVGPREPFDTAGDPAVDPTTRDRVRNDGRRAQSGDAVGGDRLSFDTGREIALEHDLARQIGLALL